MPPLVLADFMDVINIAHRFNHKPDVRTPLRVILHENLRKVKRDEYLRLARLIKLVWLRKVRKIIGLATSKVIIICFQDCGNPR